MLHQGHVDLFPWLQFTDAELTVAGGCEKALVTNTGSDNEKEALSESAAR